MDIRFFVDHCGDFDGIWMVFLDGLDESFYRFKRRGFCEVVMGDDELFLGGLGDFDDLGFDFGGCGFDIDVVSVRN